MSTSKVFPDADVGLLRPGDRADVVVLDDGLDIRAAYRDGLPLG